MKTAGKVIHPFATDAKYFSAGLNPMSMTLVGLTVPNVQEPSQAFVSCYSYPPNNTDNFPLVHGTVPLSRFQTVVNDWRQGYEVAKIIVRALRRKAKYGELQEDYDQGIIDKDAFRLRAREFATVARQLLPDQVLRECQIALELAGETQLDAEELGLMLDMDPMQLEFTFQHSESGPSSQQLQFTSA